MVRSCPSPVGRAHPIPKRSNNFLVFGAPASLIGSELPGYRLRPFALLLSYGARSAQADLRREWGIAKPTIPFPSLSWYRSTPSVGTSPIRVERNHSFAVCARDLLGTTI